MGAGGKNRISRSDMTAGQGIPDPDGYIRKITGAGLLVNLALTGFKLVCGYAGKSQALVADAIHSLSDSITDIAVIAGSYFWSEPPDQCHPYGHQRVETMITLGIGAMVLAAGIGIGWHAVTAMHEAEGRHPGWIAFAASAVSLVSKEILFRWTDRAAKQVKSSALSANAWHHRSDAVSSIPVFLAVGGSLLFPRLSFLDQLGALIVSVFICQASFRILWPGIQELMEKGAPAEIIAGIEALAMAEPEVIQVHQIRTRYLGSGLRIDFHLVVDGAMTISRGHEIAERVKQKLLGQIPDLEDAVIHVEPHDHAR